MEANVQKKRNCIKEKDFDVFSGETKRIHIPLEEEEYNEILYDHKAFRNRLNELIKEYPELFPERIVNGYKFHDVLPDSKKLPGIRFRRIEIKWTQEIYTIAPFFILPYMCGYTEDVEKPLFLRQFGVPYWALTYVFGRNDMYWYRVENRIGRNSIVGTTIKDADDLPEHILCDEKFSKENRDRVYIPTTVSGDCILGASVVSKADHLNLITSYSYFKKEAQNLCSDYQPTTINTDGWKATRWALKMLFPATSLVLCFLHSFLKVRDCCRHFLNYSEICSQIWQAFHAQSEPEFREKLLNLSRWAHLNISRGHALESVYKLCNKVDEFAKAYWLPDCYRTSATLDRIMDRQDRFLYSCKYFHGHKISSEYSVRAWAIMHNFLPYSPRSGLSSSFVSPAHRVNGFVYHQNWLKNLIVSSSMGGFRQ